MPADAVFEFLQKARSVPLLPPDQIARLPEPNRDDPHLELATFCDQLTEQGILTALQSKWVQAGKWDDLAVGPYAILQENDDTTLQSYRARHTLSGDEVTLIPLSGGSTAERLRAIADLEHPHLALGGTLFQSTTDVWWLIRRPGPGANLGYLVADIGPMPYTMAANYARQIAQALSVAHGRGLIHGMVRPDCWYVPVLSPLPKPRPDGTIRHRPAPTSPVLLDGWDIPIPKLTIQQLPPMAPAGSAVFLAPERIHTSAPTAAGDVYGLGATLYFLLAGRAPFVVNTMGDLVVRLRDGVPMHLGAIRPDIPKELVTVVEEMLRRDAERRPTARALIETLAMLSREPSKSREEAPSEVIDLPPLDPNDPDGAPVSAIVRPDSWIAAFPPERTAEPEPPPSPPVVNMAPMPYVPPELPPGTTSGMAASDYTPAEYVPSAMESPESASLPTRSQRNSAKSGSSNWKVWLLVGLVLNLIGLVGWAYLFGWFNSPPPSEPTKPAKRGRA